MKAWAQLVVAVLAAVYAALTDGGIDSQEWVVIAGTAFGAFGVWITPNLPPGEVANFAKGAVSFLTAGASVLYVAILGGLTQAELIEVILAGCAAVGLVVALPNAKYPWATQSKVTITRTATARSGPDDPGT